MSHRNLSPQNMFMALAKEHKPKHLFAAETPFEQWKAAALPPVLQTLGEVPPPVEPNAELLGEWQHDGLFKQKWLLDVGPHISATFLINYPASYRCGQKLPTIQCWHGHGPSGKEPIMGNDGTSELKAQIEQENCNYGHQMAKAGFITYAIDWMGAGERNDANRPNFHNHAGGRDWCNLLYLHATMFGTTSLAMNLAHGRLATDFAATLPGVDAQRLGIMGHSGGGAMTLWAALTDSRYKAAEIICYSQMWEDFGIRDVNYCGMQVAPGLFALVDLPDLQGLLAPLPLLIDIGAFDHGFKIDSSMQCHHRLEAIYAAAGAADNLHLDLFPGDHGWGGNKSTEFFGQYLV